MRILVRSVMGVVALAAFVLSFASLAHLGQLCGYAGLSWLYPVVVDLGAVASCAAWLHTRGRQPLLMTWALLTTSILLNATTHYLESTGTAPSWLLVVAVAAVPPTVLGLCVHLAVGLGEPTAVPQIDVGGLDEVSEDEGADPIAELIEQGAGRRRIAQVAGVSEYKARKMIEERR